MDKSSGPSTPLRVNEWRVTLRSSGQANHKRNQQQVPHTATMRPVRNDNLGRPWAKYRVARPLGVSHTWVNKLVKRFEADPDRMRRRMAAFAPTSFEKLERAREETRRQRELGWLRGPIRWRRVKVTLEGRKRRVGVPTRAEVKRRGLLREERVETQRDSASRAGRVNPAPTKASAMPVRYAELPLWARGLLLPGDPGTAGRPLSGPFVPQGKQAGGGTPRPVPFAFRRRR